MSLLAVVSVLAGWATTVFAAFLGHEGEWPSMAMLLVSVAVAGTGIGVGWWVYGRRSMVVNTRVWKQRFGFFYDMLVQKFYFDLTYDHFIIGGYMRSADALAVFDQKGVDAVVNGAGRGWVAASKGAWRFDGGVIDAAVNGLATLAVSIGRRARRLQTGQLQSYQRLVLGAVVVLMLVLVVVSRGA